jgi:hypothetical protein
LAAEIRHAEMMDARILLCGIDHNLYKHIKDSGVLDMIGKDAVFLGNRQIFSATQEAIEYAKCMIKL